MIQAVYAKAAPILAPLFLVIAILGWGGYVIQWGTIKKLQGELLKDKDKQIQVIVDTQDIAKEVSKVYEGQTNTREIHYEKIKGDTETIIKTNTVFLNVCISDDGVQHYNNYIASNGIEPGK